MNPDETEIIELTNAQLALDANAELEQRVPVATVACEPRRLDRDHDSDAYLTDGGQQLLEARPRDATAGAAEIVIDDGNIAPAQLSRALRVCWKCSSRRMPARRRGRRSSELFAYVKKRRQQ
jgi:hypothetical protein